MLLDSMHTLMNPTNMPTHLNTVGIEMKTKSPLFLSYYDKMMLCVMYAETVRKLFSASILWQSTFGKKPSKSALRYIGKPIQMSTLQ